MVLHAETPGNSLSRTDDRCAPLRPVRHRCTALGANEERFWSRVKKGSDCWEWTGWKDERGYGRLLRKDRRGKIKAHRVAWILANGPIPADALICHHCDNPSCVRADHLFAGSPADNSRDAMRKGRLPRGESHPHAKLADRHVAEIRALLRGGMLQTEVARRFGVRKSTICGIAKGNHWRHIA